MAALRCGVLPLVTFILVAVAVGNVTAKKIPWWMIKTAQKQGPNVCVVEIVPDSTHYLYTECKYWNHRNVCGQKAEYRYHCCEGFKQVPGQKGCTGVKPLVSLVETAKQAGAKRFARFLVDSGLAEELNDMDQTFTLFAPSDQCFKSVDREMHKKLLESKNNPRSAVLMYHIAPGRVESKHFTADRLLDTMLSGKSVRINKYSSGIETVNCAVIRRKDQEALNGVVHVIGSYLDPSYSVEDDLATVLRKDGRFTEMVKAFHRSDLGRKLASKHQAFTVFSPSDEAFQKMSAPRLERIMRDATARDALLANHIVPHPICMSAIIDEHEIKTVDGHTLSVNCDSRGVVVNGVHISGTGGTVSSSNGLGILIDEVLLTDRALSLVQLMEKEKLSIFLELVQLGGLEDRLENEANFTVFAPSDEAMRALDSSTLQELRTSRVKAQRFVMFHLAHGVYLTSQFADNRVLRCLDEDHPIRLQVYRKAWGVESAMIQKQDVQGINGCLHVIDRAIFPTDASAGDILRQKGEFSIFLQAMEKVTEKNPDALHLEQADSSFTFFAPSDLAFQQQFGARRLEKIMNDLPYLTKIVKNHVVENMMCSESFKKDLTYELKTQQNSVNVYRKKGGHSNHSLMVENARMTTCDIMNTNGVIHLVDQVLLPDQDNRILDDY